MSHRRQGHPLRETRIVDMYMARADLILCVEYVRLYILLSLGSNSLEQGGREKGGEIEPKRRRIRC